jgi:hypothetical protein
MHEPVLSDSAGFGQAADFVREDHYWAFISYSSEDRRWADSLHRGLEHTGFLATSREGPSPTCPSRSGYAPFF